MKKIRNLVARGKNAGLIAGLVLSLNACEPNINDLMTPQERAKYEQTGILPANIEARKDKKKKDNRVTAFAYTTMTAVLLCAWYIGKDNKKQK